VTFGYLQVLRVRPSLRSNASAAAFLKFHGNRPTNLTLTQEKKLENVYDACYHCRVATNVKDLIDELKELNSKGISQAKIARMLGVTRQRVNSWFKGDVTPTFEAGLKIQELLKGRK
jgi:DNA-binding XRE family transcriptional regulator